MKRRYFWIITLIIISVDQLIKNYININRPDFLFIKYATNNGAAFGFFSGWNMALAILTLFVAAVIIYLYLKEPKYFNESSVAVSASLITGGALSNLIDRITYGHVIDYINLGFFPVFNIADMALTIGAAILIVTWWNE